MTQKAKKKNNAIEFYRFLFTLFLTFGHLIVFGWRTNGKIQTESGFLFLGGARVLGFFLFLSGYLMMAHYQSRKRKGLTDGEASKQAWEYDLRRYAAMIPTMFGSVLFCFVVINIACGTPLSKIPSLLMRSWWEFLGLHQLGLGGYNEMKTLEAFSEAINTTNVSVMWNGPLWYVSAMLIVGVVLYYVLAKNEDLFKGFFAPLVIIGSYGYAMLNQGAEFDRVTTGWLGIPNNILRVGAGMCVGALLYYVVEYLKKIEETPKKRTILTILHAFFACYFVYTAWFGIKWTEFANNAFVLPFMAVLLINQDAISDFLNNSFCGYLGSLSLYMYCYHVGIIWLLVYFAPNLNYAQTAPLHVLGVVGISIIAKWIDMKFIKPQTNKLFQ